MTFVPYSHSLLAAVVLAGIAGALVWVATGSRGAASRRRRRRTAGIIAILVATHYVLDAAVASDLPLLTHRPALGLDVSISVGVALESALVVGGTWLYLRATVPTDRLGRVGIPALSLVMIVFNTYVATATPPAGVAGLAPSNLAAYAVLAAAAHWLDRHRRPRAGAFRQPRPAHAPVEQ